MTLVDTVKIGKLGGEARARNLTPEERSEAARRMNEARWAGHEAKRPASAARKKAVGKKGGKKAGKGK